MSETIQGVFHGALRHTTSYQAITSFHWAGEGGNHTQGGFSISHRPARHPRPFRTLPHMPSLRRFFAPMQFPESNRIDHGVCLPCRGTSNECHGEACSAWHLVDALRSGTKSSDKRLPTEVETARTG
ncbi:hypothetical protein SCLCIDRAFT_245931 [Scleroderma citrinum Foug A]|uniref:Uncharacterized protein n=1 Tax=Scleroderma citrinum Foug A TaxID=1036808 RepID=A0A0C3D684_9AGAM|nr:hypothetical protein SCLCIDRAFT_245931 [Scleroderma citrinum Foug A]